jgi:hypothetical protein
MTMWDTLIIVKRLIAMMKTSCGTLVGGFVPIFYSGFVSLSLPLSPPPPPLKLDYLRAPVLQRGDETFALSLKKACLVVNQPAPKGICVCAVSVCMCVYTLYYDIYARRFLCFYCHLQINVGHSSH